MPAPPGNPSKHSVANSSSEAAEGNSCSELCYYRLVWLLLEYFVGRAVMDARLLADLPGGVVFRVPCDLDVSVVQSFELLRSLSVRIARFVYPFSC